jgi:hypothetical protein
LTRPGERCESSLRPRLKQGCFEAKLALAPDLDDASQRAAYRITLNEGPPYRMGRLEITGLPENDIKRLLGRWQLRAGAVFDASYPNEFLKKAMESLGTRNAAALDEVRMSAKPNR